MRSLRMYLILLALILIVEVIAYLLAPGIWLTLVATYHLTGAALILVVVDLFLPLALLRLV